MKRVFLCVLAYIVVPVFFILFISANIQSNKQYFENTNRWLPKISSGPLLHDIAFTNPSKFSLDNKGSLLVLYYTQGKHLITNSNMGVKDLSLFYRLDCSLSEDGEISYNDYNYSCPNLTVDKTLSYNEFDCVSGQIITYEDIAICNEDIIRSNKIQAVITEQKLYLTGAD